MMKSRSFLTLLFLAVALPVAFLTSCGDNKSAQTDPGANAKYRYAVAMTGVV